MSRIVKENINGVKEFYGQYKCDSCGKIVYEVETVKSMDFCAKCYQETFGITKKDQKIIDLEAKLAKNRKWLASNEGFLENEKLKQQLAEKDQAIENWKTMYESVMQTCNNDEKEIGRLREQLANKEKEIGNLHYKTAMKNMDYYIEGAIAALEKVRYYAKHIQGGLIDYIDQQISRLRGGK